MSLVLIALAGGLGATARHLVNTTAAAPRRATWIVNVLGSFVFGLVVGADSPTAITVGFLGGFTTFSAASVETAELVMSRRHRAAAVHAVGMLVVCVAAAWGGHALT